MLCGIPLEILVICALMKLQGAVHQDAQLHV